MLREFCKWIRIQAIKASFDKLNLSARAHDHIKGGENNC